MTKGKNYNSIVFLTTLSVYLGLVLVGATPQVLAQAALTRNFDIQVEAEIKDDLDKKPDDYEGLEKDIEKVGNLNLAKSILDFISDLKKLESIGKLQTGTDLNFSYKNWKTDFGTTVRSSQNSDISNPWLETAVGQLAFAAAPPLFSEISDYTSNCEEEETTCREDSVKIEINSDELVLTYGFTKSTVEKAKIAAEKFNQLFVSKKDTAKETTVRRIYENTKAVSENNQIFIVTRLPRGSIDSLLAKNAQQ